MKNCNSFLETCFDWASHSWFIETNLYRYLNGQSSQQPPPPYPAPYDSYSTRRDLSTLHATSPYGLTQCPLHRLQPCGCMPVQCKIEVCIIYVQNIFYTIRKKCLHSNNFHFWEHKTDLWCQVSEAWSTRTR